VGKKNALLVFRALELSVGKNQMCILCGGFSLFVRFFIRLLVTGWLKIRRGVKACEVRQKRLQRFNVTSFVHSIFQHYPYFCFLILTFYFLRI